MLLLLLLLLLVNATIAGYEKLPVAKRFEPFRNGEIFE